MNAAHRNHANAILAAAACAAVVGGLTAPPEPARLAAVRAETIAVQLAASVAPDVVAAANSEPVVATVTADLDQPAPSAVAYASVDSLLSSLVIAAGAIVIAPLWYLATPVTLPLSVAGGIALVDVLSRFTFFGGSSAPKDPLTVVGTGALLGLVVYVGAPLLALGAVLSPFASLFSVSPSAAFEVPSPNPGHPADVAASAADVGAPQPPLAAVRAPAGEGSADESAAQSTRPDTVAAPAAGVVAEEVHIVEAPTDPRSAGRRTAASDAAPERGGRTEGGRGMARRDSASGARGQEDSASADNSGPDTR